MRICPDEPPSRREMPFTGGNEGNEVCGEESAICESCGTLISVIRGNHERQETHDTWRKSLSDDGFVLGIRVLAEAHEQVEIVVLGLNLVADLSIASVVPLMLTEKGKRANVQNELSCRIGGTQPHENGFEIGLLTSNF